MIYIEDVTDADPLRKRSPAILIRGRLRIPPGRYALLAADNSWRRSVIDLLIGTRPPQTGRVLRDGTPSWAIARPSFIRGRPTGLQLIRLVARLYHLDRRLCEGIVAEALTDPSRLDTSIMTWDSNSQIEFSHMLALLPNFDIYAIDGGLPFRKGRFTAMWKALFEQRVSGKTLIMSTTRAGDATEFCERALIVDNGQIRISDQLERALVDYPPRPAPEGTGAAAEPVLVDTGDII